MPASPGASISGSEFHAASGEQQRILAQMEMYPTRAEEVTQLWLLEGDLDIGRLDNAIAATVLSHDMLRARLEVDPQRGALAAIFNGFDGIERSFVEGGPGQLDAAVRTVFEVPLTTHDRWFQAVLLSIGEREHALALRMHHGLVDGYSSLIVQREIWNRYASGSMSPGEGPQYIGCGRAESPSDEESERWWVRRLAGARPVSVLPDARMTGSQFEASEAGLLIPPAAADVLRQLARENRTSLLCVLLTAHMMTIRTFSGEDDIVVAVPYLNREDPSTAEVVGPFVNLVPIRAILEKRSLDENIRVVAVALRDSIAHAHVPYDRMMSTFDWANDGGFGLARSSIQIQPTGELSDLVTVGGLRVRAVAPPTTPLRFDFVCSIAESKAGLAGTFFYRSDRYTGAVAESIRDHFCTVLGAEVALSASATPVAGRARTPAVGEGGTPRLRRLLDFAGFGAEDIVVHDHRGPVTLRVFRSMVESYAEALGSLQRTPLRVALCLGSTADQAAGLIATWRSGSTAILLDPRHPEQRKAAILADSAPDLILSEPITTRSNRDTSPAILSSAMICHADQPAYVIYTSGTDGIPKGVEASFDNVEYLLSLLSSLEIPYPGQNPLGAAFDGWIWATLLPWVTGKAVVMLPQGARGITSLVDGGPSSVTLTPTMLAEIEPSEAPEVIIAAGEPLGSVLAERYSGRCRLINAYGPTEATVCVSWSDTAAGEDPTTIGRPGPGVTVRLLDERLRPVPLGAVGEICVAGPGVTRGYAGRTSLTARRFVADPEGYNGGRIYRTGDLGVVGGDGLIRFVSRKDGQVKIAGVRVELDEVANVLRGCGGVREAAAVLAAGDDGIPEVWAGVVADTSEVAQSQPWDSTLCTDECERLLLPEARPRRLLRLAAIPRSSSGKLDRDQLRSLLESRIHSRDDTTQEERRGTAAEPVVGGVSDKIAVIWSRILDVDVTDYERTFFEYGGHSLAAARVIGALRKEFKRGIPSLVLFNYPTVNGLSAWLEENPST